jgi:hypothetical protein
MYGITRSLRATPFSALRAATVSINIDTTTAEWSPCTTGERGGRKKSNGGDTP